MGGDDHPTRRWSSSPPSSASSSLVPLLLFVAAVLSSAPGHVSGSVVIRNYTFPEIQDEPAVFGPRIPAKGVTGTLKVAVPIEGCTGALTNPYTGPWIALLERSLPAKQCSFVLKVRSFLFSFPTTPTSKQKSL